MINIIAAFLVFGIIILIHEFGHFLFAKLNGIGVVEFSLGMGPRLLSVTKGETKYSLKLLPFGGSCMMLGEDENETDEKAFNNKSVWARISVIAAGPIFNFILALIFALIIVGYAGYDAPKLTGVSDGFPAQEAGMQPGDIITRMNGEKITVYRDISLYLMIHPGETLEIEYKRPVSPDSQEMSTHKATIVPKYSEEYGTYMMGIQVSGQNQPAGSWLETLKYGIYEVKFCITSTIKSIGMMFGGQVKVDEAVAGPIRIVSMIGGVVEESSNYGWTSVILSLVNLSMILSASLGIMNLLPIPALDGGRLVFLLIEAIRGKPIDREKEGMVHMAGMVLLMLLMVFVLYNDIRSLF